MMRALVCGLIASFFFAFTFILNRSMDVEGGSWAWSACLRFLFMLPILLAITLGKGGIPGALRHLRQNLAAYLLWSTLGFGLLYASVCFGASFGEGWLVAATWQVTIVAGPLLTPFLLKPSSSETGLPFYRRIPFRSMRWSLLILAGIFLMQWEHAREISLRLALSCVLPILLGAFMYPLGNRKMMEICKDSIDTFQRVLNMTIASLPFWLILAVWAALTYGPPSAGQLGQSVLVALFSGVLATILFFAATNLVKQDPAKLASVEATQAGEVIFALLGEIVLLDAPLPAPVSLAGMALIMAGIVLHSLRGR